MTNHDRPQGLVALFIGHMAGTIDLAALPLWIGVLMANYKLRPEQAGLTVTLYLACIVISSVVLAPRFDKLRPRWIATVGFAAAAVCFAAASRLAVSPDELPALLLLHAVGGLFAGTALSVTHGLFGRTSNPHRNFGLANVAVGVLAVLMFAILPGQIAQKGGQVIFVAFAMTLAVASLSALLFYPETDIKRQAAAGRTLQNRPPIPRVAFLVIGGVICLILNQAMVFSFLERIGVARGFASEQVQWVLVALGFINLLPGALAALLQKRLSPFTVGIAGPALQAVLALLLTHSTQFPFFAGPALFYAAIVLFTHTFLFGALSHVDPTGRAVAATPAMMMTGAALGPVVGGGLVAVFGFQGIGWAVLVLAIVAVTLMLTAGRLSARNVIARPEPVAT